MRKSTWIILLALSLGFNIGLASFMLADRLHQPSFHRGRLPIPPPPGERAHGEGPRHGPPSPRQLAERHLSRLDRHIELSKSQRRGLQAILENTMPRIVEQHRRIGEIRREVGAQISIAELDPGAFRELVDSLNEEQARLDSLVMESMLAEAELLTPEQRRQYAMTMPWGRPPGGPGRRP